MIIMLTLTIEEDPFFNRISDIAEIIEESVKSNGGTIEIPYHIFSPTPWLYTRQGYDRFDENLYRCQFAMTTLIDGWDQSILEHIHKGITERAGRRINFLSCGFEYPDTTYRTSNPPYLKKTWSFHE